VLPEVSGLTPSLARRWRAAGVPGWVPRGLLTGGWVATLAVAVSSDGTTCSAADPSVCGPDQGFAFWGTFAFATPLLLWWKPLLGCAAGAVFAGADLRFDPDATARLAFGTHGSACVLVAAWMLLAVQQQHAVAREITGDGTTGLERVRREHPRGGPAHRDHRDPAHRDRVQRDRVQRDRVHRDEATSAVSPRAAAGIGALLLLAAASAVVYQHVTSTEDAHLRRAVVVQAQVVARDPGNDRIRVRTEPAPGLPAREHALDVQDLGPYRLRAQVPVRVDPASAGWMRLVAEPDDVTYWLTLTYGSLLVALVLAGSELGGRQARRRLCTGTHPACAVRVAPDRSGRALLLPVEQGPRIGTGRDRTDSTEPVPLARMAVFLAEPRGQRPAPESEPEESDPDGWSSEDQASFGRAWRGEETADDEPLGPDQDLAEDAVLIGDLRYGGWAALLTQDAILLPAGPLRPPPSRNAALVWLREHTGIRPSPEDDDDLEDQVARGELPGVPVPADRLMVEPPLPLTVRAVPLSRVLGGAMILLALVVAPLAEFWLARTWWSRLPVFLVFSQLLTAGSHRAAFAVTLDRDRLRVNTGAMIHNVPWGRLHGVRILGEHLVLAWEPDVLLELETVDLPPLLRTHGRDPEQLAALMMRLRERSSLAPPPGPTRQRPGLLWPLMALLILECAAIAAV